MLFDDPKDNAKVNKCIEDAWNTLAKTGLISHSVDQCPNTEDWNRLYERIHWEYPLTEHEVYVRLMNLRKQGKCPAPHGRKAKKREQDL